MLVIAKGTGGHPIVGGYSPESWTGRGFHRDPPQDVEQGRVSFFFALTDPSGNSAPTLFVRRPDAQSTREDGGLARPGFGTGDMRINAGRAGRSWISRSDHGDFQPQGHSFLDPNSKMEFVAGDLAVFALLPTSK